MKTIASFSVALALLLTSCATINPAITSAIPFLRPGVALVTSGYLLIDSKNRPADIAQLQKVATVIDSNQGGTVTDIQWLSQLLAQYFPNQGAYINLVGGIVDVAASLIPQLQGDPAALHQAFHEIASGITDATALYTVQALSRDRIKQQRAFWAEQYAKRPPVMRKAEIRR